ncbi:MAG: hypothetical protein AB8I80_07150 [Anaerolineae bacterium]|jgi:hypothetical protein
MLERVHEHIVSELGQSARTDTIFVITAVVFNLVVLGVNSAVAGEASNGGNVTSDTILGVLIVVSLIINTIAVTALSVGRATREKLLEGLLAMYRDNEVAQYYDPSLLTNYARRYWLFTGVIVCLGLTAIVVPLIVRLS